VEVFGLGALNKNEALNGGGALFVKNNPNLRLRLVPLYICLDTATTLLILRPLRQEQPQPPPSRGITIYVCPHYYMHFIDVSTCMDCMPLYMRLCAAMYVSAYRYVCVAVCYVCAW
jgi:hypothetical protein